MNEEKQAELYKPRRQVCPVGQPAEDARALAFLSALAKASPLHKVRWQAVHGYEVQKLTLMSARSLHLVIPRE
jgi:hypothetical protein